LDLREPEIGALVKHLRGQAADQRDRTAGGGEMAASFGKGRAAKAMTEGIAVALRRARAALVAAVRSASGNIIVRRFGRENAPPAADERMFARIGLFHDDSICALCGRLISDHT
jgi:hypothetical protein